MYLQLFSCGYEEYPECGKWELLFPVAFNAARTSLSILRLTAVFFLQKPYKYRFLLDAFVPGFELF